MLKFLIKKSRNVEPSNPPIPQNEAPIPIEEPIPTEAPSIEELMPTDAPNSYETYVKGGYLESDPAKRKQILEYHLNQ